MTQQPTHGKRHPDEIESDIEQTRSRLDDTLNALEKKFSPKQWMNDTYDYVCHGGANDFVTNLGDTVKRNPMPVVLAGVGLGWLMLSSSQRNRHHGDHYYDEQYPDEMHDYLQEDRSPGAHYSAAGPGRTAEVRSTTGAPAVGTAGAGTTSAGTNPALAGTPTDHTGRQGSGQGRMRAAKDRARHMVSGAGDRTTHAKDSSRAAMGNLSHKAQGAGSEASHFVQEHPLVAGALGIALGAALGGLLPSTRTEDEYLGETRDRALDKAATAGQQQADKAQAKIEEKGEQARSSAETTHASSSSATYATSSSAADKAGSTGQAMSSDTPPPTRPVMPPDKPLSNDYGTDSPIKPGTDNPPTRGG